MSDAIIVSERNTLLGESSHVRYLPLIWPKLHDNGYVRSEAAREKSVFSIMMLIYLSKTLPLTWLTGLAGIEVASSSRTAAVPVDVWGTVDACPDTRDTAPRAILTLRRDSMAWEESKRQCEWDSEYPRKRSKCQAARRCLSISWPFECITA